MFDIVKKLMVARQITMDKGAIKLLDQRMIMSPSITFYYLQNAVKDKEELGKIIYYSSKLANSGGYSKGISEEFGMKGQKLLEWMMNSAMLAGWGEFELIDFDAKEKKAIVRVLNSAIAENFSKHNAPVDHVIRGYMAGAADLIFDAEMDYVETKCVGCGDKYCEFVCKPTKDFDFKSDLVSSQLDESGKIEKMLKEAYYAKKNKGN